MNGVANRAHHVGHFVPWDGGCLLIGSAGSVVAFHAHYAIQIALGARPGIRFRSDEREPWREFAGAIIPSRQPHAMDATSVQPNAVIFVEPETREGRALAQRYLRGGIASIADESIASSGPALFSAWRQGDSIAVEHAARQLVRALTGPIEPAVASDPRILNAIAHIQAHLDASLSLEEVAAVACLSPSRFRHLFVEQTGIGLRPYILWRRLLRVWQLLAAGESLSRAAHDAGFADSAHLSRTSRAMFGFPPSAMQAGALAPVVQCDSDRAAAGPTAPGSPTAAFPTR